MSELRFHSPPRWTVVAGEQFRMLGLSLWRMAALAASVLMLGTVLMLLSWWEARTNPEISFGAALHPNVANPLVLAAFFLPLAVWRSEDPSRRGYHWSMPVERGTHTLTRTFFGWVWLLAAMGAYMLWMGLLSLLGSPEVHANNPPLPAWQWLVPISALTIGYLLGSIVVLASEHPWRWYVGIPLGLAVLGAFADAGRIEGLRSALRNLLAGPWGLGTALFGGDLTDWLGATAVWLALGLVGVAVAALRHRE